MSFEGLRWGVRKIYDGSWSDQVPRAFPNAGLWCWVNALTQAPKPLCSAVKDPQIVACIAYGDQDPYILGSLEMLLRTDFREPPTRDPYNSRRRLVCGME